MRSIFSKSFLFLFYWLRRENNRCLQLKAAKKTFASEIEAICATWPASQQAGPKWRPVPEELVHKTLESDFPKNDRISMRSPSSNAIIWRGNVFSRDSSNADAAVLWMKEISEPDWNDFISAELISVSCLLTLLLHVQNWIFNALQSLNTYKACKGVNYTKVCAILW